MIENNPLAVAHDLTIDSNFWQWCIKSKPSKVIYFNSSACYPLDLQKKNKTRFHTKVALGTIQVIGYQGIDR